MRPKTETEDPRSVAVSLVVPDVAPLEVLADILGEIAADLWLDGKFAPVDVV